MRRPFLALTSILLLLVGLVSDHLALTLGGGFLLWVIIKTIEVRRLRASASPAYQEDRVAGAIVWDVAVIIASLAITMGLLSAIGQKARTCYFQEASPNAMPKAPSPQLEENRVALMRGFRERGTLTESAYLKLRQATGAGVARNVTNRVLSEKDQV